MKGLTEKQVIESKEKYGSNKLPEPKMKKWYDFAKEALSETLTRILIMIALLQLLLAILGVMEYSEPIMIMLLLGIITAIAVKTGLGVQKSSAELRRKTSERFCDVIRDGKLQSINKDELVVGDIALVGFGQEIFADGYIIEGKVSVNNAAINGESEECKKTPVEGYVHEKTTSTDAYTNQNCLFSGTTVMSGEGKMLVTDVGINTVNGDTLVKMQTLEAPKTALDIALDKLSAFISKWGTAAALVTFAILIITGIIEVGAKAYFNGSALEIVQKFAINLSVALTIIVAAVPEGLPLIVKLVTKQNVKTMERCNVLAKNPGKIPELAYVDLICTDKTGTLTTGVMSPKTVLDYTGCEADRDSKLFEELKNNMVLNNSATFDDKGNPTGGNSIDRALMYLLTPEENDKINASQIQKIKQTFTSSNKFSAFTNDQNVTYYKGATERIIEKCTKAMTPEGEIIDFDSTIIDERIAELNNQSIRCIALAMVNTLHVEDTLADDMVFLGVVGVADPIRKEVPDAVKRAHEAGIQIIEITGDNIVTATAIAKECGIYKDGELALTNAEFEELTDDEIKNIIPKLRVIARCSPNTKLRLITLAQEIGMSVAMTGDGVNDSPALKRADVGFGMQTGSDVAKQASDVILTDDNFASIVKGVELGRTFMHNIMMFLEFQLPINIALLILSMLFPVIASGAVLLASVQILIINIVMDSLNSLSFGGEPPKKEYMDEKPIKKGSGLFIRGAKSKIAVSTIAFIIAYLLFIFTPVNGMFTDENSMSARFALLCIMAVLNGFNIRTESMNLFKGLKNNKLFVLIALGIVAGVVLLCSFTGTLLHLAPLSLKQWLVVTALAFTVIVVDLIRKAVLKLNR
ncbi:MAG: cation-transporting P-type ATPase [Ruminococcaceae bacterium]|nr:cation-transporting P-type ATPase [Oscillospiraceae bacterium]